jgi:2-amino-4-hydroxy-6-hydroxymethyldihydropteridine diphosphokinase
MSEIVYIGMGTNLGDRVSNFSMALREIESREVMVVQKCSSLYKTVPWGLKDQPWFLNAVIFGETELDPASLLKKIKLIEGLMGPRDERKWGPRYLDLDILLYGEHIIDQPGLNIPHRHMSERAFVLVPFLEIAPNKTDPLTGRKISDFLGELNKDELLGVEMYSAPIL